MQYSFDFLHQACCPKIEGINGAHALGCGANSKTFAQMLALRVIAYVKAGSGLCISSLH